MPGFLKAHKKKTRIILLVLVFVDSARLGMLVVNLLHTMYNCELHYRIKIFPFLLIF